MPIPNLKTSSDVLGFAIKRGEESSEQSNRRYEEVMQEVNKYKQQLEELLGTVGEREPMPQIQEKYDFHNKLHPALRNAVVPLAVMIAAYNRPKFAEALGNVAQDYEKEMQMEYERNMQQWALRDKNRAEEIQTKARIVGDLFSQTAQEARDIANDNAAQKWFSVLGPYFGALVEKENASAARALQNEHQKAQMAIELAKLGGGLGKKIEPDDLIRFIDQAQKQLEVVSIMAHGAPQGEKEKLLLYGSILKKYIDNSILALGQMLGEFGGQQPNEGQDDTPTPKFDVDLGVGQDDVANNRKKIKIKIDRTSDRNLLGRLK